MRVFNAPTGFSQTLISIQRRGGAVVPLCLRRCGFQEGARRGLMGHGLMQSECRDSRSQGFERCGEGAFGEMIVECSTSSQAKSEPRKEALAEVCHCCGSRNSCDFPERDAFHSLKHPSQSEEPGSKGGMLPLSFRGW